LTFLQAITKKKTVFFCDFCNFETVLQTADKIRHCEGRNIWNIMVGLIIINILQEKLLLKGLKRFQYAHKYNEMLSHHQARPTKRL
jgi:hypothetical protein